MTAADYFLKIAGIEGESTDARHRGEIDLDSWSFGESQPAAPAGGSGGGHGGKVSFQDFQFAAKVSKASPKLFLACASGEHLASAVLTCRKKGVPPIEFLTVTLSDVTVSAYQASGSAGSDVLPVDLVSLRFGKIQMRYIEQKADGTLAPPLEEGWDVAHNRKI